jgi:hypothetical protein
LEHNEEISVFVDKLKKTGKDEDENQRRPYPLRIGKSPDPISYFITL